MKALTLWQPWATLVALGAKQFETRSWRTDHRGLLAIHAASTHKGFETAHYNGVITALLEQAGLSMWHLPRGAVVCVVRLVNCMPAEDVRDVLENFDLALGDFSTGRFAWELKLDKVFREPIPARGGQKLWDWEPPEAVAYQERGE